MSKADSHSGFFNQEFRLRVISAIVLAVLVLWITWIGGYTFNLLWAVITVAIFYEYCRICRSSLPSFIVLGGLAALLLTIASDLVASREQALWLAVASIFTLMIWEFVTNRSLWAAIGFVYCLLPFFAMSDLRGESYDGLLVIILIFGCVWGADIFAYFFGRLIGGPKLAPRISPKKTWAGFIGSIVGAIGVSAIIAISANFSLTTVFLLTMLIVGVASQVGDLIESVLKRNFGVKDSGKLIPGHGGVLDRIDGLIFSAVTMWLILNYMQGANDTEGSLATLFLSAFLQQG